MKNTVMFSALFAVGSLLAADVSYTESGTVNAPIAIPAGTVYEISVAEGVTVTNTGAITGAGSLKLVGGGMLALDAVNTFSGGMEINGGFVNALREGCLGTGPIRCTSTQYRHGLNFFATGAIFPNDITFEKAGKNPSSAGYASDFGSHHLYFDTATTLDGNVRFTFGGGNAILVGGKYGDTTSKIVSTASSPTAAPSICISSLTATSPSTAG